MQPDDTMVCPDCGSEFQPHVARCIDCGAPTRPAGAGADPRPKERPAFSLPRESAAMILSQDRDLAKMESLGSFLEEHGIPCRIEELEVEGAKVKRFDFYVCVAGEDLERAEELRHELLLIENPGFADAFRPLPSLDQCPACGSRVSPESAECQSCGLALEPEPPE